MDPSTTPPPNTQNPTPTDQVVNRAQPPQVNTQSVPSATSVQTEPQIPPTQPQKTPMTISVNKEAGSATIAAPETPLDNQEDEIQVAPQENKANAFQQQGGPAEREDVEVQAVEVQPSIPEAQIEKSAESFIEKSSDQEKPELPKEVQDAGVTHSGPGIIDGATASFPAAPIPISYQQAVLEEKKTQLHDSKHWLMGKIIYLWRKLNPNADKKEVVA